MRLKKADGTVNTFVDGSGTGIDKKAAWTAKMALTDGGKAVISPYIQAPTQDGGDARTFGGGNETLGGVEIVIGRNPMNFSGVMRGVPQSIIKVMKSLQCEAQGDNLGVILFDENGNIEAIKSVTSLSPSARSLSAIRFTEVLKLLITTPSAGSSCLTIQTISASCSLMTSTHLPTSFLQLN